MKSNEQSLLDTMNFVLDRAAEDMVRQEGQVAPIDFYDLVDDKTWDEATQIGEASADYLFQDVFAPQRQAIAKMLHETITEIATKELGNADLALDLNIDDDDIDELLMLSLDPAASATPQQAEPPVTTPPEIQKESTNG